MLWIDGKLYERTADGYRQVRPLVRNVRDGSILVLVPGGEFEMGDGQDSDCPRHRVQLDAFYMGVYCVTNGQYGRFVREGKGRAPENSSCGGGGACNPLDPCDMKPKHTV